MRADVAEIGAEADDHAAAPSRLIHQRAHAADGGLQPDEDGLADQEMADVQLHHLRDRGDGRDRAVVDAVAGVDFKAQSLRVAGGCLQPFEMAGRLRVVAAAERVAIGADMQFDHLCADVGRCAHLMGRRPG